VLERQYPQISILKEIKEEEENCADNVKRVRIPMALGTLCWNGFVLTHPYSYLSFQQL
jgi:hypothetical protein